MTDYTVKRIDELDSLFDGVFKRARAELGVSSFGMQILDLPPDGGGLKHDEVNSNQEEVYVTLRGSGFVKTEQEELPLSPETLVRVGPTVSRQLVAGAEGLRVLAIGGILGQAYEAPAFTELDAPGPAI